MPPRKILSCLLATIALIAIASPARAGAWNYACKGALPVFDESALIIFNRMLLFLLPKTLLKGTLRDLAFRDPVDDVLAMANAKDINSGLAESLVFMLLDDPNKKLTLTEKSSRTISDIREKAAGPRNAQTTTYVKVYHYISDFGYQGPFDIKMDCVNYQLGAPLR